MENIVVAIPIIILVLFLFALIIYFFLGIVEFVYIKIFHRPFYVHWYKSLEKLPPPEIVFLKEHFSFYNRLKPKHQAFFQHRVSCFISKYEFIPREEIVLNQEIRVMVAATAVQLTFGMRNYLTDIFKYIVIYPDIYQSVITENWHKGEFNPRLKTIVFSWKHFKEGFGVENDNLNLGIHEFAHVLNFHGLKSKDASATLFAIQYRKMLVYLKKPNIQQKLIASDYIRVYGFTNQFEFFAVLLEHFFETPEIFKKEFPLLFLKIQRMINYTNRWEK
jgi:hypothetical protein